MTRAGIAFDGGDVIDEVSFVFGGVSGAAAAAIFFVHPGDYADGALGMQAELLAQIGDLHCFGDSIGVVDCAGAQIPRVQMAGDYDDFFGMLAAF